MFQIYHFSGIKQVQWWHLFVKEVKLRTTFCTYCFFKSLTLLLKDALGGNCETVMLCCVSTSESSLRDTLSTLKYGHLARQIKNSPVVNEVRHLKQISWSQIFKMAFF